MAISNTRWEGWEEIYIQVNDRYESTRYEHQLFDYIKGIKVSRLSIESRTAYKRMKRMNQYRETNNHV